MVFTTIGATLSILQVDQSRALVIIERALALDATFAWAWTRQGYALAYSGRPAEGLRSLEHAIVLSPDDPVLFNAYAGIATCHFLLGDFQECVRWVQKALHDRPGMVWANRLLATAAAHAGDLDLARTAVQRLLSAHPDLTIRQVVAAIHNIDGTYLDQYTHGLRLAGLPEDARPPTPAGAAAYPPVLVD
jgi:adenylate cyclase